MKIFYSSDTFVNMFFLKVSFRYMLQEKKKKESSSIESINGSVLYSLDLRKYIQK